MHEDQNQVSQPLAAFGEDVRLEWTTPSVRRMRAGDAENAFTTRVEDGIFTGS